MMSVSLLKCFSWLLDHHYNYMCINRCIKHIYIYKEYIYGCALHANTTTPTSRSTTVLLLLVLQQQLLLLLLLPLLAVVVIQPPRPQHGGNPQHPVINIYIYMYIHIIYIYTLHKYYFWSWKSLWQILRISFWLQTLATSLVASSQRSSHSDLTNFPETIQRSIDSVRLVRLSIPERLRLDALYGV